MLPGGATLTGAEPELREEDRAQLERLVAIVDRLRPFGDWMTADIDRAQPWRSSTSS